MLWSAGPQSTGRRSPEQGHSSKHVAWSWTQADSLEPQPVTNPGHWAFSKHTTRAHAQEPGLYGPAPHVHRVSQLRPSDKGLMPSFRTQQGQIPSLPPPPPGLCNAILSSLPSTELSPPGGLAPAPGGRARRPAPQQSPSQTHRRARRAAEDTQKHKPSTCPRSHCPNWARRACGAAEGGQQNGSIG